MYGCAFVVVSKSRTRRGESEAEIAVLPALQRQVETSDLSIQLPPERHVSRRQARWVDLARVERAPIEVGLLLRHDDAIEQAVVLIGREVESALNDVDPTFVDVQVRSDEPIGHDHVVVDDDDDVSTGGVDAPVSRSPWAGIRLSNQQPFDAVIDREAWACGLFGTIVDNDDLKWWSLLVTEAGDQPIELPRAVVRRHDDRRRERDLCLF